MYVFTVHPDPEKWREFLQTHPRGNIFQSPEMCKVYKHTKNYEPMAMAAIDDTGGIAALLVAVIIKDLNGPLSTFTTRSIIQGGPLYTNIEALEFLMEQYNNAAGKQAMYTQIRNHWDTGEIRNLLESRGYVFEDHLNYLINLDRSVEDIWRGIQKYRRKGIKRAEKNGVVIRKIESMEEVEDCYQLIKETYNRVRIPLAGITLFKNAYKMLQGVADFYIALWKGKPVGTRITLTYNGVVHDWYAGSRKDTAYVDEALVWHILKENAGKEKTFDFGGAGHPKKPYGVREFKKRFGGEEVNYGRYEKTHNTWKKKIAEAGFKIYRKIKIE